MLGLIKDTFLYVGIYTTIANVWKVCELFRYGEIKPRDRDTVIALILTALIYVLI